MRSFFFLILFSTFVFASNFNDVSKARFKYFLWDVYDIELHKNGPFSFDKDFMLKLHYLRKIEGHKIAKTSIEEIRKLGFYDEVTLAGWYEQLNRIFPDVDNGTTLSAYYKPNEKVVFYNEKKEIGRVLDNQFGRWFFGIWLDERTSLPEVRKRLINAKN